MMLQDLPEDLISTTQDILHEARRNPEMNPRIGPLTRLEEYKDDPNIFISFTEIDKAGLNPLSDYNTPLGIYCYPLKISWDYYGVDRALETFKSDLKMGSSKKLPPSKLVKAERRAIKNAFPFATQNPYIQVIRAKKPLTDLQKFSKQDFLNTLDAIEEMFIDMSADPAEVIEHILSTAENNARIKTAGGTFWYLTYLLTYPFEQERNLPSHTSIYLKKYSFLDRYKTKEPMRAWNYLLRELGHDGFIDKGESIIHEGEPAQAVFLHRGVFKKVDRVLNKSSVLSQKKKKIGTWMNKNKISKDAKWYIEAEARRNSPAYIRWESGTFIDGVWELGRFEGGTFAGGIWKGGTFQGDIFAGVIFKRGVFEGGRFEGDIFAGGSFKNGTFADGKFKDGKFKGGTFVGGTFEDGIFKGGIFKGGTFAGGIFKESVWVNGIWEDGVWVVGLIYSKKFEDYVSSMVNPNRFSMIEDEVDTIEELKERV